MEPSIPGLIVCAVLLGLGWRLGAPLLIALFASLPMLSTAFAALPTLGGSTPLIYTLLALLFIVQTASRKAILAELSLVLRQHPTAWIVLGLLVYSIGSALLLPRLFAGETSVFVVSRGGILEQPLAPTNGNLTQTAYFALGAMAYYALLIQLRSPGMRRQVDHAFLVYLVLSVAFGVIDLSGKIVGLGDVMASIRTASYTLLTEVSAAGFWRIVGATPEASSFAISMLSCLAFATSYWRTTGDRRMLVLASASLVLLLLCTSTTAYVGLGILGLVQGLVMLSRFATGRIARRDLIILTSLPVFAIAALGVHVSEEKALEPVAKLIDVMIINKAASDSGKEREYWNRRSLETLSDTWGLGTGFGSSRASSWPIAVVSQLGVAGALLMSLLLVALLRGPWDAARQRPELQDLALFRGARACGLAFLIGGSISGGAADPGIHFFLCLAVAAAPAPAVEHSASPSSNPSDRMGQILAH